MKKPTTLDVLLLAQKELREFYARDSRSQALVELKNKIEELQVDEGSDRKFCVLNLQPRDLSEALKEKIVDNELYTYMDTHDLLEHLYSVDSIIEQAEEKSIALTKKEITSLQKLQTLMSEKDCAYFRIVKF